MLITFWCSVVFALLMAGFAMAARLTVKRKGWRCLRVAVWLAAIASLPAIAMSGYLGYHWAAGQPGPMTAQLADGVRYERLIMDDPRPVVAHVVEIELNKGHRFIVTKPIQTPDGLRNRASVTTDALIDLDADLAINASFFRPFHDNWLLDYAPQAGDDVEPIGNTVSNGVVYGLTRDKWPALCLDQNGRARFGKIEDTTLHAVSGRRWVLRAGERVEHEHPSTRKAYPRVAVALSDDRGSMWLVLIDGKQPRYSEGMTLGELADLLIDLGASEAINLDGGGSATLAIRSNGGTRVLNRPCHTKIPGRQRPVANHLGLRFTDGPPGP